MRAVRTIISAVFIITIFGSVYPVRNAIATSDERRATSDDALSAYYGFGELEIIKLNYGIKGLRIADFNGDGRNDIAIANNRKAKIELLLQKESIGPGVASVTVNPEDIDVNAIFESAPTRFDRQSVSVIQTISSLVCGDLNSDGMVDLAFYGDDPKGLYVILQKAGVVEEAQPKTLSWRTRKKIKIDDGLVRAGALVCADLNNDGADDLALAGRDAVYIILQKADGSLAEPVKYPTTAMPRGIEVGDLNGDKINDLLIITNDSEKPVHIRFGRQSGQLGPQMQFFIENPYALELYNTDRADGDEMLTVAYKSGRLICYKLGAEKQADADWPILSYPLASAEGSTKRDLVVGDFDGNGLVDIVISDPAAAELILYKQAAGPGLDEPVRFPSFADITNLSATDIDGDGKDEIGVLSVKEKIIGVSKFEDDRLSFPKPVDVTDEPVAMELADIDSDGNTDCLYISRDTNDIRYLRVIYNLNSEEKKVKLKKSKKAKKPDKADETDAGLKLEKLASNPDGLKVIDVDQDGLQDVLIFVKYENPILVRQTQKREFEVIDSPKAQASLIKDASLSSIAVADMDGQKGKELLIAQKNFARSLVFSEGKSWKVIDQYNAKSPENNISAVAVFDISADVQQGEAAILLLDGQKGQLQILKAEDDKTYRLEKELDIGVWNTALHLKMAYAPLTGSDVKSILLFDSEKFALITPPSKGQLPQHLEQQYSYQTKIKDGVYGNLTAGDINSDGWADIIMLEYKGNHIEILALDAENKPTPAMRFKVFEQKSYRERQSRNKVHIEPRELKVADVTGDGKDDLITVIHDRIIIYPQD